MPIKHRLLALLVVLIWGFNFVVGGYTMKR